VRFFLAIFFWFAIAIAAIALVGAYTALTMDAPMSYPARTV